MSTTCPIEKAPSLHVVCARSSARRGPERVLISVADPFLAQQPPRVRYDGFACRGAEIASDSLLVTTLADAYSELAGEAPTLVATTATTDARLFLAEGIPAVCFGALAENVHGINERVNIPSMIAAAQTLAVFIRDWCGLADAGVSA